MKITASTLHLDATHQRQEKFNFSTSLRAWGDGNPPSSTRQTVASVPPPPPSAAVHISEAGHHAQATDSIAINDAIEAAKNDPKLRLIRAMIALLTGHDPIALETTAPPGSAPEQTDGDNPAAPQSSSDTTPSAQTSSASTTGWGVEYERHTSYSESEQLNFSANGIIQTADGQEIHFEISLQISRSFTLQSDLSLRLGDAARPKKDPLILNFAGNAAQLTDQRFAFDLDADGQNENINFATGGSGFLAIDRNGNGRIDNGSELFGAKSGDGFADLAKLDSDGNGWIDANDPAYAQLRLLSKSASGQEHLSSLSDKGIGAIALAQISTPFALRDGQNTAQGDIRAGGVFVRDDGQAGTIQQVDLTV